MRFKITTFFDKEDFLENSRIPQNKKDFSSNISDKSFLLYLIYTAKFTGCRLHWLAIKNVSTNGMMKAAMSQNEL